MNANKIIVKSLNDTKVNIKIILAALWTGHFLLWSFGDMASLMQKISEPAADNLLLFVAVPLEVVQALMIFWSLSGKAKIMRWVNIIAAVVFVVFNIQFMIDAHTGWEYLLGSAYLLFNVLIIWYAWKWPKQEVQLS
jgi:hypothetical protein